MSSAGRAARRSAQLLPGLRDELSLDLVVLNGENAAAGRGLTERHRAGALPRRRRRRSPRATTSSTSASSSQSSTTTGQSCGPRTIRRARRAAVSSRYRQAHGDEPHGAHVHARRSRRPVPGGRRAARRGAPRTARSSSSTSTLRRRARSRRIAWYLDGRVAAVVGTHTHVPTADARVLPGGTAMVTDLGMAARATPSIGDDVSVGPRPLPHQHADPPARSPTGSEVMLNSVLIDVRRSDGARATSIERVDRAWCASRSSVMRRRPQREHRRLPHALDPLRRPAFAVRARRPRGVARRARHGAVRPRHARRPRGGARGRRETPRLPADPRRRALLRPPRHRGAHARPVRRPGRRRAALGARPLPPRSHRARGSAWSRLLEAASAHRSSGSACRRSPARPRSAGRTSRRRCRAGHVADLRRGVRSLPRPRRLRRTSSARRSARPTRSR